MYALSMQFTFIIWIIGTIGILLATSSAAQHFWEFDWLVWIIGLAIFAAFSLFMTKAQEDLTDEYESAHNHYAIIGAV